MDAASAYISPIRAGGGTRLKVLDAFAMRCPMVATGATVAGLPVQDGVHFLRAETPAEFVAALKKVSNNPQLYLQLQTSGRQLVEADYSWETIGLRLERAIKQL